MANNPGIFNAVINGSAGGFNSYRWITEGGNYTSFRNSIVIIANLVDSKIPTQTLTTPELSLMESLCANIFASRYPPDNPEFNAIANSIVELWTSLRSSLESQGGSVPDGSLDGQILYWDETGGTGWNVTPTAPTNNQYPIWNAGSNEFEFATAPSVGNLQYFDTTNSPVGLWNFDDTLADISGNGNDFTLSEGSLAFTDIVPGKRALYVLNGARYETVDSPSELRLTGDMTGLAILQRDRSATTDKTFFFRYGGPTETEADNILYTYSAEITGTDPTSPRRCSYFAEEGAGNNIEFISNGDQSLSPVHNIEFVGFRRQSNVITFFNNGVQFGGVSGTLTTPTGGTTSKMLVGCSSPLGGGDSNNNPFVMFSLKIIDRALSDSEIIAEYNRTVGQAFGQIS